jgi:hypothetical protein
MVVFTHRATLAPAARVPVYVTVLPKSPLTGLPRVALVVQVAAVPTSTATAARRVLDADVAVRLVVYVPDLELELVTVTTPAATGAAAV